MRTLAGGASQRPHELLGLGYVEKHGITHSGRYVDDPLRVGDEHQVRTRKPAEGARWTCHTRALVKICTAENCAAMRRNTSIMPRFKT